MLTYKRPVQVNVNPSVKFIPGEGDYDGVELRRTPGVPDSRFVAFALPSLVNGVRVYPKRTT